VTPATLDPTCMHASTNDIGVHLHLDHPHFPHCKQRRPIRLVGELTLRPGSVGGPAEARFPLRQRSHGFARQMSPPDPRFVARVASGPATFADGLMTFAAGQVSPVDRLSRLNSNEERPRRSHWIPQAARAGVHRQERRPRRQPRKAALSSGLVQSRLLSCPRHGSEAPGQTGHVSRQVDNLTRHVDDLAGGARKGLRGRLTRSRPESICGKSASSGSTISVESPRTRLPATCFRGAASGI